MNFPVKIIMRLWVGAVLIAGLSACANTSPTPMANSPLTGPVNTGTYPHFTPDPKGETTQFTPEEKEALRARTTAAKNSQVGPSSDPAVAARRQAEMQLLKKQQEDDLKAIEGR
ncbi:hypothetical protein [Phyllobacterium zundukense]|uniref:Lipoprotein n=1 Tax=Phyllobacterium zundukense TaxID=1867719 RepID=A0A2N9W1R8_9HYPH|nr:hypothetical protein [Phyllobacterium zundukense]ATU91541.1 hypothetical protein BLM14_07795 [Phyllobacterium zundukense]PIO45686.1 hypothetical protein B5P45_06735 [Phyllobacterium zundukense]